MQKSSDGVLLGRICMVTMISWRCFHSKSPAKPPSDSEVRMHYVGYAELAAAVSNAGGLGTDWGSVRAMLEECGFIQKLN